MDYSIIVAATASDPARCSTSHRMQELPWQSILCIREKTVLIRLR